jgi:hypothetical protein
MRWKLIVGIIFLVLSFTAGQVMADELPSSSQTSKPQEAKYPPYPDVWGYEFPMSEHNRGSQIRVHKTAGGGYAVTYVIERLMKNGTRYFQHEGIYFFSGKRIESGDMRRYIKNRNIYGKTVSQADIRINEVLWERNQELFRCNPEFSKYTVARYEYAPRRIKEQRSIIYFIEEPIRQYYDYEVVYRKCVEEAGWQKFEGKFYFTQVFAVFPSFVSLKDDTFLLYDHMGNFIIRLDKDFNSKSVLLNSKVFIVNTEDIKTIEATLLKEYALNQQTYVNVVAEYIKALKKGKPRETALKEALNNIKNIKVDGKGDRLL